MDRTRYLMRIRRVTSFNQYLSFCISSIILLKGFVFLWLPIIVPVQFFGLPFLFLHICNLSELGQGGISIQENPTLTIEENSVIIKECRYNKDMNLLSEETDTRQIRGRQKSEQDIQF